MNMPIVDMISIIGNIIIIGLVSIDRPPTVNISTIMPTTAMIITTGRIFIRMLPGITRGMSGGGWTFTSPPGARGGEIRGRRTNPIVAIVPPRRTSLTHCAAGLS